MYHQETGVEEHCLCPDGVSGVPCGVVLSVCFLAEEVTGRLVQNATDTAGGENGSNALCIWKRVGSIPPWRTLPSHQEG